MSANKTRFVMLCQRVLVLGTVAALAAPGAGVTDLEIVGPRPSQDRAQAGAAARPDAAPDPVALVASAPVEPEVREEPLEGVDADGLDTLGRAPAARRRAARDLAALSAPADVKGFATVGVTWGPGVRLEEDEVTVSVRSREDGRWSGWEIVEYHDEHGPDPGSAEARHARPGTEPIVVGDVDQVQVKLETADGEVPADAQLALVDPKETAAGSRQEAAIDTAELPPDGALALSAASSASAVGVTPRPKIFSRAQWGADERLRDKSSLSYHEVHAGFVHHTVNANGYTRAQVPGLIRGIYAYHTRSRGWSDIGYNFIVDRFGRIWEGRYGGVDRPVVGAHTLGYNEYSFAMSALGNFEQAKPSAAMLDAYGRLFAWKLSLHGVSASSARQWVGKRSFPAISGHRDAGSTACPGRHLYARIGRIRQLATGYQAPFTSRARSTDLAGSPWPDLAVRNASTKRVHLLRTGGQTNFQRGQGGTPGWQAMDLITVTRDVTGDGIPDVVARRRDTKVTTIHPGTPQGSFARAASETARFSKADLLLGALDMTGDGRDDLVARMAGGSNLWVYPGDGHGGFRKRRVLATGWDRFELTAAAGDLTGDGGNDLVARDGSRLFLVPRQGRRLGAPVALPGKWGHYSLVSGAGDLTGDGRADLLVKARKSRLVHVLPGDGKGRFGARLGPFGQFKGLDYLAAAGQLAGDPGVDLVGRNGQGRLVVYPHNGGRNVESVVATDLRLPGADLLLNVGDWNGDGRGDLVARTPSGRIRLHAGAGPGKFAAPVTMGKGWGGVRLVAAVGDITGDGHPDLMGQPRGKAMRIYPGDGAAGFLPGYVAHSAISSDRHTGLGLWDTDGSPDSLLRRGDGSLAVYRGNGPGGLLGPTTVASGAKGYDWIVSTGDATGDGRPDVVVRESRTGTLWLLPGTARGLAPRRLLATGYGRYDLSG